MVNFVKPQLLGTIAEFKNRFVNPIQNGQHSDSTDRDVRIMKKRSFILNDLLKGCMQRLDYNVLVPYLQPKYEYVLCICLTEFQKKLYQFYLENYARAGQIGSGGKLEGNRLANTISVSAFIIFFFTTIHRWKERRPFLRCSKSESSLEPSIHSKDGQNKGRNKASDGRG